MLNPVTATSTRVQLADTDESARCCAAPTGSAASA
jgi:hypothetical protein